MKSALLKSILICLFLWIGNFVCAQDIDLASTSQKRKDVENNPESIETHSAFLKLFSKKDSPAVNAQYKLWMKRFPASAMVPYAVAKFYYGNENPQARPYLLKAVANKPAFAEAWNLLSIDALFWGDFNGAFEYTLKAAKADRTNADYAYWLFYLTEERDKIKYDSLGLDLVLRFPEHDRAAMVLGDLAFKTNDHIIKVAYYEQLYSLFHESQPISFRAAMSYYFTYLIDSGLPAEAYALALKMVLDKQKRNGLEWKSKIKVALQYMDLQALLKEKKYDEALVLLNNIKVVDAFSVSTVSSTEKLLLLKAKVNDLAGKTREAYDTLVVYYSKSLSQDVIKPVMMYAAKLGIDSSRVDKDIRSLRDIKRIMADDLVFTEYGTLKKVRLSDYNGKVVLLTYWFPGCAPCRAEFPHFENVLKKFNKKEVVYLGINAFSDQDAFVLPFMSNTGYSFTPLKEGKNKDRGNLPAFGYPTNYLIDRKGKIAHTKFRTAKTTENRLEMMITELLAEK